MQAACQGEQELGAQPAALVITHCRVMPPRVTKSACPLAAGAVQAVRQGGQELDAQLAAASFNNRFRDTYGTVQPRWLECGWQEATQQAHAEFKFLFVYLHSPQHQVIAACCH